MPILLIQIAPQRSAHYASLAETLAPQELRLSVLDAICDVHGPDAISLITLGGQRYARLALNTPPEATHLEALEAMGTLGAIYELHDPVVPLLRPIEPIKTPDPLDEMVHTRRYKGKTNELFTRFLLNCARHSSSFAKTPWSALRLLDPLCGGGTTLFSALSLGASVIGIEKTAEDVSTSVGFVRQYFNELRLRFTEKEERLRSVGRRWRFDLSEPVPARQLMLANGDTRDCVALLNGFKPAHLIVTDLPYGIQHKGPLGDLVGEALPAWERMLEPGGVIAFSWDATRFGRAEMLTAVQTAVPGLQVLDHTPYNALAHTVDRVIKRRDILVARKPGNIQP
jgi:SAM-dependent methyltransferase